ncbi:MAG: acyl-CoA dehydrogenase [Cytophagales bacterium]|nr:MAG: acyl-CoA dehydrogenase [Cytophagales bacterium]
MEAVQKKELIRGGEFLFKQLDPEQIFIPEDFDEEAKMVAENCQTFIEKEVQPQLELLDKAESPQDMVNCLNKAAELSLLGAAVPEQYEGLGMNFNNSMLIADYLGGGHSFAVAFSAHTNIGTLPIVYYGDEAQKQKYLPKLATGEWKACYCLTEPDAGSDANSGKTKAIPTADGKHYILNGQKMWITNAGFADLFIVFAKIEDDKNLSAFIVEKNFGGISFNPPERKMGIKGSDTRQVFFNDCQVPAENLLSTRGNGFKIAVNILNIGRIKLGATNVGMARNALNHAIRYANERKQFNTTIASFGAIQHKIAEQATRIFASESAIYRAGQNIDDCTEAYIAEGINDAEAKLKSFEQFAIECAMMKVHASEVLDYCADQTVQVFGGMGFSAEAPADRCYRDARINRIYEGTNEINRILCINTLLKRVAKGELPLQKITQEKNITINSIQTIDEAKKLIKQSKNTFLLLLNEVTQHFKEQIGGEHEILMDLANMMIEIYVAESVMLRVEKLNQIQGSQQHTWAMAQIYLQTAVEKMQQATQNIINAYLEGDEYEKMHNYLQLALKTPVFNAKNARRNLAQYLSKENRYTFTVA